MSTEITIPSRLGHVVYGWDTHRRATCIGVVTGESLPEFGVDAMYKIKITCPVFRALNGGCDILYDYGTNLFNPDSDWLWTRSNTMLLRPALRAELAEPLSNTPGGTRCKEIEGWSIVKEVNRV